MAETLGADISAHQGDVNFELAWNHGVRYFAIKVSEGVNFIDPSFGKTSDLKAARIDHLRTRFAACEKAGHVAIPYHFARADNRPTAAGARQEADWFCDVLTMVGYGHGRPVLFDYEVDPCTRAWAQAFAARVKERRGRGVVTYVGRFRWGAQKAPPDGQMLWLPAYVSRPLFNVYAAFMRARGFVVRFWQYTSDGQVSGVGGGVDLDRYFGTVSELRAWAKAPAPPKAPPVPPVLNEPPSGLELQRALNRFTGTGRWVSGCQPLVTDGDVGPATNKRIKEAKWFLGYTGAPQRATDYTRLFLVRLAQPNGSAVPAKMRAVGKTRRTAQRVQWARQHFRALVVPGVGWYDGVPCAKWLIPYLDWARQHGGWNGWLVNGHRTPAYSESLCKRICGKPSCPGTCAGQTSNHKGVAKPAGALDVTDYVQFGKAMAKCPLVPKLVNRLGAADPVHYSVSGR